MDGSFLSDKEVVAASRDFVCIRLATYEDKVETKFLTQVFSGRNGDLQNTVFGMLSPDAERFLVRTGRGPHFAFADPSEMAKYMRNAIDDYDVRSPGNQSLPVMKSLELAMNVAACDGLQLIVRVVDEQSADSDFDRALERSVWNDRLAGQFVCARATRAELKPVAGVEIETGLVVVEPDGFGTSGLAIEQLNETASQKEIDTTLKRALRARVPVAKDVQAHIRAGVAMGLDWETEVPVTDQQSVQARSRYRSSN